MFSRVLLHSIRAHQPSLIAHPSSLFLREIPAHPLHAWLRQSLQWVCPSGTSPDSHPTPVSNSWHTLQATILLALRLPAHLPQTPAHPAHPPTSAASTPASQDHRSAYYVPEPSVRVPLT